MERIKKVYRYGELFCGAGGLAYGVLQAEVLFGRNTYKIEHTWANDIDPDACQTYRNNIPMNDPASVRDIPVKDFIQSGTFAEEIDALGFGFPCNDFSILGKHQGLKGEYGPLYTFGVKALEVHKPDWFIAENVSGLRNANDGKAFRLILQRLMNAGSGYDVVPHLYKFEEYGVPQKRHRIIVIGIREDLSKKFSVPAPTTPHPDDWVTAAEALQGIPQDASNQKMTKHTETVKKRLEALKPGQNAWESSLEDDLQLNVKGARLSHIYKIIEPEKPSYTITGSGGGGTHGYHWEKRALTNRERARLQTFPDDYIFFGGKESIRRQIGMAVPPKAAEIIVEAVLKTIAGKPYESVEANLSEYLVEQLDFLDQ